MSRFVVLKGALLAAAMVLNAPGSLAQAPAPVLIELFTSQGCSSCPPADAALGRLAKDPRIVAISRPVTYWDRLGWKDTLARESNTTLQRVYATHGGKGSGVYTPQVVIQGGAAVVGSREGEIRTLSKRAMSPARIEVRPGGPVLVDGPAGKPATVTLIALKSEAEVAIGRGENNGRRVRYTNVVLSERPIGLWKGGKAEFALPTGALNVAGADRYALVVQERNAGKVLAARYL